MTLELNCSSKEIKEVLSRKKIIISREIRPSNAWKYVHLNDEEECTGVIEYDKILLKCTRPNLTSVEVEVKKIMLMEIVDDDGNLVHYEQNGKLYQMVDIDYHLGKVLDITGVIAPIV